MIYLCDKYGTNQSLYPKDLEKRARINELLFIDADRINGSIIRYVVSYNYDDDEFKLEKFYLQNCQRVINISDGRNIQ